MSKRFQRAANAIALEVPSDQVEYFYRKLHQLLDEAIDRSDQTFVEFDEEEIDTRELSIFESLVDASLLREQASERIQNKILSKAAMSINQAAQSLESAVDDLSNHPCI